MKYERSAVFLTDYLRLTKWERELFADAVRKLNTAHEDWRRKWPPSWPAALRIKPIKGAAGVWEMTWSFSGPDGRATFEFVMVEGEAAIRWRRVGGHEIFREP